MKEFKSSKEARQYNFNNCHRNQFFIDYKLEQTNNTCELCHRKLDFSTLVIHHEIYDHECVFIERVQVKRKMLRRGKITFPTQNVPDCERCYNEHKGNFLKCQELTQLIHKKCHARTHLQDPNSTASAELFARKKRNIES